MLMNIIELERLINLMLTHENVVDGKLGENSQVLAEIYGAMNYAGAKQLDTSLLTIEQSHVVDRALQLFEEVNSVDIGEK